MWFVATVLLMLLNDSHSFGGFSLTHNHVKMRLGMQKFLTAEHAGTWSSRKKPHVCASLNSHRKIDR